MIITPAYRKFHAELVDFNDFVTANLENPPADFNSAMLRGLNGMAALFEGDDRLSVILSDDMEIILCLISLLVDNDDYAEPANALWKLSQNSTETAFEQHIAQFKERLVFDETYGWDGSNVFGEDIMKEHLRGFELVHETEMTPRAFYGLEESLNAFKTWLSWHPEIGQNPFDTATITDDFMRLTRIVRGA